MRFVRFPVLFLAAIWLTTAGGPSATVGRVVAATAIKTVRDCLRPELGRSDHEDSRWKKYIVVVGHYSCSSAASYVRKLVKQKVFKKYGIYAGVKGGPKGWSCAANRSTTGLAYSGLCSNPSGSGAYFQWAGQGLQ